MDFEIDIIGKFLRFNPVQNTNLSYGETLLVFYLIYGYWYCLTF